MSNELKEEEVYLFETIMEVYKENPLLALSCISKDNIDKFELFLKGKLGDRSILIIKEIREVKGLKKAHSLVENAPVRK